MAEHVVEASLVTGRKTRDGCLGGKRRRTVSTFKGDYGTGNGSATDSIRAVTYSVAEIDVIAETAGVWRGASESCALGEHVAEADLATGGKSGNRCDCGAGNCRE